MRSARARLAVAGTALTFAAFGTVFDVAAADVNTWEPAQVVPHSTNAKTPALFSTQHGRAVVVYHADRAVWGSSLPPGAEKSWTRPSELRVPRTSAVGPVATGSAGGATVFLGGAYTRMTPTGTWGAVRAFPYDRLHLSKALVRPGSGLVAAGTTFRPVKTAVKPPGRHWMLSPALSLGYTLVRGLWYDPHGRVHVLVTQDQHLDTSPTPQNQKAGSPRPIGLYQALLHQRNGALSWGPLRQWRTGSVGSLYDWAGLGFATSLLSTADGAITVLWHEYDATRDGLVLLMRHRDAAGSWSHVRRMPVNNFSQVMSSLDNVGTTRLSYLRHVSGSANWQLVTRQLSADGTLSDPVQVDGPLPITGFRLDGVSAPGGGATLLRWYADTGAVPVQERLYRCLPASGCTSVGTQNARGGEVGMAVTPNGAALLAGVDAVKGCPASRLCSRRLPAP